MKTASESFILNLNRESLDSVLLAGTSLDWRAIFGHDRPVDLEIGIGTGSFILPWALDHPDRNMIGIELVGQYLRKADRKLRTRRLTNVRLLLGNAKLYIWKLIAPNAIEHD